MQVTKQIRGNCQCCGRQQAVKSGTMAKHGYTVERGWFTGVCSGERFAPMQVSREQTDKIITDITAQIPELIAKAEKVKTGKITPQFIIRGRYDSKQEVPFADATLREKSSALTSLEWSFRNRAHAGESFIKTLAEIADEKHNTALVEILK